MSKYFTVAYYNSKTKTFSTYHKGEIVEEYLNIDEVHIDGFDTYTFPITVTAIHRDTKFEFPSDFPAEADIYDIDTRRILSLDMAGYIHDLDE